MIEDNKLRKVREGDLKSIEEICASTWEAVYRFTYYKVQNREEAEDITQETYVKEISHILRGNTKIEKCISFLKSVSLNIIRDRWRKRKHQGISVNLDNVNPEETAIEDPAEAGAQRELIKVTQNTGKDAIVEVRTNNSPVSKVYLKKLIRQDNTGIWTVVGIDTK